MTQMTDNQALQSIAKSLEKLSTPLMTYNPKSKSSLRKPIQTTYNDNCFTTTCDDGTIWTYGHSWTKGIPDPWQRLPDIPQDNEVNEEEDK